VAVQSHWLQLERDMLITGVTCRKSRNGTSCDLELVRPEAYDMRPLPDTEEADPWQ
jgi:prophage tail gpP-like protein